MEIVTKVKSPLEQVAYEIEFERMKELLSKRFKHIEESVYERIKKEMHTERFNEVLSIVIEKHGVKESLNILTECIQKVAQESILTLLKKKN
jgi:hypothetical protein